MIILTYLIGFSQYRRALLSLIPSHPNRLCLMLAGLILSVPVAAQSCDLTVTGIFVDAVDANLTPIPNGSHHRQVLYLFDQLSTANSQPLPAGVQRVGCELHLSPSNIFRDGQYNLCIDIVSQSQDVLFAHCVVS